jgi:hypothetical protein
MGEGLIVRKGGLKFFSFYDDFHSSSGWNQYNGSFNFAKNALTPNTRPSAGTLRPTYNRCCDMEKSVVGLLNGDFAINLKFKFLNATANMMGAVSIALRNGTTNKLVISCLDGWGVAVESQFSVTDGVTTLYTTGPATTFNSFYGDVTIKRENGKLSVLKDGTPLASDIDFAEAIDFNNIIIEFAGNDTHPAPTMQIDYLGIRG